MSPPRRRTALGAAILLVALVVALTLGSGIGGPPPSLAQRARALESQIKCPSCEDISVAQSSTTASIAVRHEITQMLSAGRTDQQIESSLVAQYGPSILLQPPDRGLTSLIWILPLVAGLAALGALVVFFWRRNRQFAALDQVLPGPDPTHSDPTTAPPPPPPSSTVEPASHPPASP